MARTDHERRAARGYHSPLREAQADRTRQLILDALTELLSDRPPDEISTRDLAAAAGVAERTVYRHFPDRPTLHEGIAQRAVDLGGAGLDDSMSLDDVVDIVPAVYAGFDEHHATMRAAVLLNSDPRRLATDSRQRSADWSAVTERTFPELDDRQRRGLTAVTRLLGSSQTWLRLREEFGMDADESGALASWAVQAMLHEVRRGNPPPTD